MKEEQVRVLIVDDDPDAAATLAVVLQLDGYVVRTAADGQEALAAAAAFEPVCVLMDIQMPRLGGHETCSRLRALYGDGLILVAVTGAGVSDDRISAGFSHFDHYLRKPVDLGLLRKLLPPVEDAPSIR